MFNQTVPGNSAAIIRGVATTTGIAQAQGTTGYFINDVPLTDPFYSGGIPDIDTFDVDNVAVLRGPQGSLFGSSSMGVRSTIRPLDRTSLRSKPMSGVRSRMSGTEITVFPEM